MIILEKFNSHLLLNVYLSLWTDEKPVISWRFFNFVPKNAAIRMVSQILDANLRNQPITRDVVASVPGDSISTGWTSDLRFLMLHLSRCGSLAWVKDKFALSDMINLLHTQKFYYFVRGRREETKSVARRTTWSFGWVEKENCYS